MSVVKTQHPNQNKQMHKRETRNARKQEMRNAALRTHIFQKHTTLVLLQAAQKTQAHVHKHTCPNTGRNNYPYNDDGLNMGQNKDDALNTSTRNSTTNEHQK